MNKSRILDRKRMVKDMEFIARQVNDEGVLEGWLMCGVADEDIPYADLDPSTMNDDDWYIQDDNFKDVMDCFLRTMKRASLSGGLYCGGVVSSIDEKKSAVNIREQIKALLDKYNQENIHLEDVVLPVELYYKNGMNAGRLEMCKQILGDLEAILGDKEENT